MDKGQKRQLLGRLLGAVIELEEEKIMGACLITFGGDKGTLVSIHGDLEVHGLKEALGIISNKMGLADEAECQDLPIQN